MSNSKSAGRKSKYETHVKARFDEIREWAGIGATDKEICASLGIAESTYFDYKAKHREFSELLKEARKVPVMQIKAALFKRAVGFAYSENTQTIEAGVVVREQRHIKQALPDPACAMILLKHWAKDEGWTNDPQTLELKKKELEIREKQSEDW